MRRTRARFHPAGLVVLVLALLVQAFAPDWAALVMRALPPPAAELCLADDHRPAPAPTPKPHSHDALCPVCQAFAAVQTALAGAPPPVPGPTLQGRRARARPFRPAPRRRAGLRPKARAPPPVVRSSVPST